MNHKLFSRLATECINPDVYKYLEDADFNKQVNECLQTSREHGLNDIACEILETWVKSFYIRGARAMGNEIIKILEARHEP